MDDTELLNAFENQLISNNDWEHAYHIRIAAIYLMLNDFETALIKVKAGIKKLNAVNEVPDSQFRGFHETLTIGWLKLVSSRLYKTKTDFSLELIEKNKDLLNPRLLNEYYSTDKLMSLEAKAIFIEPDLMTFD